MQIDVKKCSKVVLDAAFLIGLIVLTFYFLFKDRSISEIIDAIHNSDGRWLLLAIVFVGVFICGESVIMKYLFKVLGTRIKLLRCIKYSFVGFFFSSVTPSATGGQPMQLVYMKKDKYRFSESCLVLLIITIGYKAALVLMSGVFFVLQGNFIFEHLNSVIYILIYGLIVNIAFISFLLVLIFHDALTEKMICGVAAILSFLHIARDKEKMQTKMLSRMQPYREGAAYLRTHQGVFFHVLWMSVVQRAALFLVTWCVYRSFGLHGISAIQIVALQTIISLSVDMLPLPGGVGASEKSFEIMFGTIFGEILVIPGMVLSRGISYYFLVLVTGLGTAVAHFSSRVKKIKKK